MNRLESRVVETLQDQAARASTPPPPLLDTLAAGRRSRALRRTGAALGAVSLLAAGAFVASLAVPALQGADQGRPGPATQPSGERTGSPTQQPSGTMYDSGIPTERRVRCADVPPVPAEGPVESSVAWTAGIVTLWLDDTGTQETTGYALSFRDDATCLGRADVRRAINHALSTAGHPPI